MQMWGIIWLASYPKSGNTWLRAFLANYMKNQDDPLPINDLVGYALGDGFVIHYERLTGKKAEDLSPDHIDRLRPQVHEWFASSKGQTVFVKTHNLVGQAGGTPLITPSATAGAIYLVRNPLDLAVSYVSLCDIPDYRRAIAEMARVLKSGGRLLAALHTPFATTSPTGWLRDEHGAKTVFPVDHYTFESGTKVSWRGIEVVNYHRPQAGYMRAFLAAGLVLADYAEPLPDAEAIAACPSVADYLRVPVFTLMEWEKR